MKERKGLHPAIACVLMLVMLCCALLNGAHRHWRDERAEVIRETQALEAEINVRAETAQNLLTVAYRHLSKDDSLCASVSGNAAVMHNTALPLGERMTACELLAENAQSLLAAMSSLPSVQADSRDRMYAELILPQALECFEDQSAFTAYAQTVRAYNEEMYSSVSGLLARLIGYRKAPEPEGDVPALAIGAAAASYPVKRGYVNDDAALLSDESVRDIDELNGRMDSAEFTVVTRHFIGGSDVREYAKGLFAHWQMDDDDVLLLMVIGEERYAVMTGGTIEGYISNEQISSLTGTHLRPALIAQRDYDGAAGDFLLALARQINRASGENADFGGLFGSAETANNEIFENWGGNWWEGFFAEYDYDDKEADAHADEFFVHEAYEADFGGLLVLCVVLMAIIRRRRASRKGGLGWFGWIILLSIISDIGDTLGHML